MHWEPIKLEPGLHDKQLRASFRQVAHIPLHFFTFPDDIPEISFAK